MFNLAHQRNDLPQNLRNEQEVFHATPDAARLQADAKAISKVMVEHGMTDPDDAIGKLGKVEYWQYLRQFKPDYMKKVLDLARKLAISFAKDFRNNPSKYPMPAPKQPGGGMPGMAASDKRVVEAIILPNGAVLVRNGTMYSVNNGRDEIMFSADPDQAIKVAMSKIAARESSLPKRKLIEG